MAYDDTHKQAFLDELARTGIQTDAMRAAGIKSFTTIRNWRKADPDFAEAYLDAQEEAADELERAARDRALNGLTRKRYDKDGNLISEEQVYSDTLIMFLLKGNKPEKFAERTKSELTSPDGTMTPQQGDTSAAVRIGAILHEAKRRRDAGEAIDPNDELFT